VRRVAIIIPARFGASRLPGKPLADIHGKPLLAHVVERARQANGIDVVVVATDDERIAAAARLAGAEVVVTGPASLAGADLVSPDVRAGMALLIAALCARGRSTIQNVYQIERGAIAAGAGGEAITYRGKTLLDIAADDYGDPRTALESKQLMRQLFGHYLGGQALQSRRVFMELQEL